MKEYYENNDYGRLYLPCGSGKSFIGYWNAIKILKCNKIFVVVPSLFLLSQVYELWATEIAYDSENNYHFILIGSDMENKDILCEYKPTTNIDTITHELNTNKIVVVLTTYQSSKLLINACKKIEYSFDLGIYDEAHRTVGEQDKCFTNLLTSNIEKKRLFMTATEKIYNHDKSKIKSIVEKEKVLSMDNEKIYGKVIIKYSLREAIEDNVLCDYRIIASTINKKQFECLVNCFIKNNNINFNIKTI